MGVCQLCGRAGAVAYTYGSFCDGDNEHRSLRCLELARDKLGWPGDVLDNLAAVADPGDEYLALCRCLVEDICGVCFCCDIHCRCLESDLRYGAF
jgi:hypothetical protein